MTKTATPMRPEARRPSRWAWDTCLHCGQLIQRTNGYVLVHVDLSADGERIEATGAYCDPARRIKWTD